MERTATAALSFRASRPITGGAAHRLTVPQPFGLGARCRRRKPPELSSLPVGISQRGFGTPTRAAMGPSPTCRRGGRHSVTSGLPVQVCCFRIADPRSPPRFPSPHSHDAAQGHDLAQSPVRPAEQKLINLVHRRNARPTVPIRVRSQDPNTAESGRRSCPYKRSSDSLPGNGFPFLPGCSTNTGWRRRLRSV